jgi:hypothetical protein
MAEQQIRFDDGIAYERMPARYFWTGWRRTLALSGSMSAAATEPSPN